MSTTDTAHRTVLECEMAHWPGMKEYFAQERVDPRTSTLRDANSAASNMACEFLYRLKKVWEEQGLAYAALGDFLRLVGENVNDIACDFAMQTDEGTDW